MSVKTNLSLFIIVLFLLCGYAGSLAQTIENNITGVYRLLPNSLEEASLPLDCRTELLDYYPTLAACLNNAIQNNPSRGRLLIESWGYQRFPDKKSLLYTFESRLFWKEGNYSASCEMLNKAGNKLEMQALAQAAFKQGKWDALERYLECIGAPTGEYWSASPSQISVMFHNLGKYLERAGSNQRALRAYLYAIDWYPTVWADPVLAAARILVETGHRDEAVKLVLENFDNAELPWSIFNLGKQLGKFLEEDGDLTGAYCAYLTAQRSGEESPIHLVPDSLRHEVQARLYFLETNYQLSSNNCTVNN